MDFEETLLMTALSQVEPGMKTPISLSI